jgi:aminoglycoside 6'-N-acetyltransferase I
MGRMNIERCTRETLDDWVRLRHALWSDESLEEHRRYALSILARPQQAIAYLVRDEAGSVIAFAEATMRADYVNGCTTSPVGFLEGLYVEPFRRGVGIAKFLCATIEAWTSNLGCTELASDVLLNNVTGQNAHKRLGFKETERVVYFVKRL